MSKEVNRPKMEKPERIQDNSNSRLTSISAKKRKTTSETPKTVRMTLAEKILAQELVEQIQTHTKTSRFQLCSYRTLFGTVCWPKKSS